MRTLKLLLALSALAALAISAVSATADDTSEGTAVLTTDVSATQTGGGHTFTVEGGKVVSCTTATFGGGSFAEGATSVTVTPTYTGCTTKIGADILGTTVNLNTCDYHIYDLTTTTTDTYAATTDLDCPGGDIVIKVYQKGKTHEDANRICEWTISPKAGLTGVHFTDNNDGTLSITATNVVVPTKRVFGVTANCGEASAVSTYNGTTLATLGPPLLGLDD